MGILCQFRSARTRRSGLSQGSVVARRCHGPPPRTGGPGLTGARSTWTQSTTAWTDSFAVERITLNRIPAVATSSLRSSRPNACTKQESSRTSWRRSRLGPTAPRSTSRGSRRRRIPIVVANALVHGDVTSRTFDAAADSTVASLMGRVRLRVGPGSPAGAARTLPRTDAACPKRAATHQTVRAARRTP